MHRCNVSLLLRANIRSQETENLPKSCNFKKKENWIGKLHNKLLSKSCNIEKKRIGPAPVGIGPAPAPAESDGQLDIYNMVQFNQVTL